MHIKQITIQGFKSYKDQNTLNDLSQGHNVIVGRNGTGKSNFFKAIRFVLSDSYGVLSKEDRQSLLHEGAGAAALAAFVELVFDNSDNRFPTGRDEVILRRTIGLKKDEYSIDRKTATKGDVMSLLESAGFSKANPYYIVPQGRIASLTNAHDDERLKLLKEVAGTRVYEDKRSESFKIIEETDQKREKIEEHLAQIDERLRELEGEKEELNSFAELDSKRRAIEYAIYFREDTEVNSKLKEIEDDRLIEIQNVSEKNTQLADLEKETRDNEDKSAQIAQNVDTLKEEKLRIEDERQEYVREKARLDLKVKDLQDSEKSSKSEEQKLKRQVADLDKEIAQKQASLANVLPKYQEKLQQESDLSGRLQSATETREALFSKQTLSTTFKSAGERDTYIRKELAQMKKSLEEEAAQSRQMKDDTRRMIARIEELSKETEQGRKEFEKRGNYLEDIKKRQAQLKETKEKFVNNRKELWSKAESVEKNVKNLRENLRAKEGSLYGFASKEVSSGLASIRTYVEQTKMKGFYGPLYELFDVDSTYHTAVEATAGGSLFHVVVDTDDTATQLLEHLNREKAGRVTFVPLNRIRERDITYPESKDAIPVVKRLRFDPALNKAFQQTFGKTLICRDLGVAEALSASHNLNCVTLAGDQVSKKGAFTGGFQEPGKSKIETVKQIKTGRQELVSAETELSKIHEEAEKLNQQISEIDGELQKATTQRQELNNAQDASSSDLAAKIKEKDRLQQDNERKGKLIASSESEIRLLEQKMESRNAELGTPLKTGLSAQENQQILTLTKEIDQLKEELTGVNKQRTEFEGRKNQLQIELSEGSVKRREEVSRRLNEIQRSETTETLEIDQRRLATVGHEIERLSARQAEIDKETDKLSAELRDLNAKLETLRTKKNTRIRELQEQAQKRDEVLSKRARYLRQQEEVNRKIRELGVPPTGFEKYKNVGVKELLSSKHKVTEDLKKYSHVNKKALEQYKNFTDSREALVKRKQDLDSSADAIHDLIEVLDQKKDEAIERTFKQVSKNFSEVFKQLVPKGKAELVMKRKANEDQSQSQSQSQPGPKKIRVDQYTGVTIKVSFTGATSMTEQLSGGQKTLVTLALIFAIQKCDPAPFYLFDEIDANLDPVYRTAVARMIHDMSQSAQFITTTFRPEMLAEAESFFGVSYANKVGTIRPINKEAALEFVQEEAVER